MSLKWFYLLNNNTGYNGHNDELITQPVKAQWVVHLQSALLNICFDCFLSSHKLSQVFWNAIRAINLRIGTDTIVLMVFYHCDLAKHVGYHVIFQTALRWQQPQQTRSIQIHAPAHSKTFSHEDSRDNKQDRSRYMHPHIPRLFHMKTHGKTQ